MSYIDELTRAVADARENLEKTVLPKLREEYSLQSTAMNGFLDLLITKRLIHYDPYNYDSKMTEIELPEISAFPDTEKASVIGRRISHYTRMLEFVTNYYQFTCNYLTPKRISNLEKLSQVFLWDDFKPTSRSPNTAALAGVIESASASLEPLTASILRTSLEQMSKSTITLRSLLAKAALCQREAYKLFIRTTVLPEVPQNVLTSGGNIDAMFTAVKKTFAARFAKHPFFQNLIHEVLTEDYSGSAENAHAGILRSLQQITELQQKKETPDIDYRQMLITGLKTLANSASHFELALEKIAFNEDLINTSGQTFFSKVAAVFRKAFNLKTPEKEITIVIEDPVTQIRKKEIINLGNFKTALERKIRIFKNINSNSPQVNAKLRQIPENILFDNFVQYVNECNSFLTQMSGLDQYYKTVKPNIRSKIKGIKIEITTIKNSIINANQYKAEYAGHLEYEQQKKKLGISTL